MGDGRLGIFWITGCYSMADYVVHINEISIMLQNTNAQDFCCNVVVDGSYWNFHP
jgi:hypothetical protein